MLLLSRETRDLLLVQPECHGVTNEVLSTSFKSKLGVDILHGALVDVKTYALLGDMQQNLISDGPTLMSSRIIFLPVLQVLEKVPRPPLFK